VLDGHTNGHGYSFRTSRYAFVGKRVPPSLKVFLMALAIIDDLGAVLVIALFYSSDIVVQNLLIGLGFVVLMILGIKWHTQYMVLCHFGYRRRMGGILLSG